MSAPRTVLAGLLLGAFSASVLQGCEPPVCGGGQSGCAAPRLVPFRSGTYGWSPGAPANGAPAAETGLTLTLDEARTRLTERYARDGHSYETEYEVVEVREVGAMRGGVPILP